MPQLGFIAEFPAVPVSTTGNYKTGFLLPTPAPVHVYSVREPNEIFMATITDLLDRKEDGATILVEAYFNLNLLGDMTAHSTSRVETGRNAVFGHFVTVKCRRGRIPDQAGQTETAHAWFKGVTGMDCPDGNRLMVNLFFNRGLALIGPNRAAPFFHLVPVFGSAMAIVLLGEELKLFHLVGYALVLAGVVIASRKGSARA